MHPYCVYILRNTHSSRTYCGTTNNPTRRLRQHNGEIKGGAKYTRAFKGLGEWTFHLQVCNLTKREALSLEKSTQRSKYRNSAEGAANIAAGRRLSPLERRVVNLRRWLHKFPEAELVWFSPEGAPEDEAAAAQGESGSGNA
jgi:predicted GIY-YIG superfamily endonuclease